MKRHRRLVENERHLREPENRQGKLSQGFTTQHLGQLVALCASKLLSMETEAELNSPMELGCLLQSGHQLPIQTTLRFLWT